MITNFINITEALFCFLLFYYISFIAFKITIILIYLFCFGFKNLHRNLSPLILFCQLYYFNTVTIHIKNILDPCTTILSAVIWKFCFFCRNLICLKLCLNLYYLILLRMDENLKAEFSKGQILKAEIQKAKLFERPKNS